MGLFNLLFDLPGKIKRNILSYQIRHSNKPKVTSYEAPVEQPMRHKKVTHKPTTQPVTPPVGVGVVPNIGQTVNPNTAVPVAPVEPVELTDKDALIAELKQKLAEAEATAKVYERAATEGKIGAAKASTDPIKMKNQADRAIKEELKKANETAEAAGLAPVEIEIEDDSTDIEDSEDEEYTPEERAAGLPDIPFYPPQ